MLTHDQQKTLRNLKQKKHFIVIADQIVARSDDARKFLKDVGVSYDDAGSWSSQLSMVGMSEAVVNRKELKDIAGSDCFDSLFSQTQRG